jgi:hypothetical protein
MRIRIGIGIHLPASIFLPACGPLPATLFIRGQSVFHPWPEANLPLAELVRGIRIFSVVNKSAGASPETLSASIVVASPDATFSPPPSSQVGDAHSRGETLSSSLGRYFCSVIAFLLKKTVVTIDDFTR